MGRFFANQKLDEAGIVGITLQKLLIFFMVIDAAAFFFGFSLFSSFMSLLFHFVVFMGVYRRRTGVLLLYVIFHVAFFILAAFALILVVSSVMYMTPIDVPNNSTSNIPPARNSSTVHPTAHPTSFDLRSMFSYAYGSTPNNRTHVATPTPHAHISSESSISSDEFQVDESFFIISIIALLFSVVLLYCKILSVVLAHKMRKLLLAPALPVSRPVESEKTEQSEPTFVPADYENNVPLFAQPGFAYQPMVPQNGYPMMPAPFMYGQQPVYYSYAPVPDNEKL